MNHKEFKITAWCIENKTTIYVFTIIITLAGMMVYNNLPKALFPDIVVPTIGVTTIYPGTSPEDIENLVTKPIEKQLKSINGVKKVTSNSIQDFSAVIVEFNTGIEVPVARQRVSDAVDKARADLPTDLDNDPVVQEFDFSEFPIMNINLAGDYSLDKLKKYAEVIQDEIESLPEITRVDIIGSPEREVQLNVDIYRLTAAGLTFGDIEAAIGRSNVNISGGDLKVNAIRRTLRVTGEFKNMEDIRSIVVRGNRGNSALLGEVATVVDGFEEKQNYARLDNKTVITLNVVKRSGQNLISASDKIESILKKLQKTKLPDGLKISVTGDQSENTRVQLNDLINTVILGFVFVVAVLMFFMGTTNAIFVGLSVPISSLLAFLFMPGLDFSLNTITMFSFLLALGIVVDDAIVVIENTHRLYHKHPEWSVAHAAKMAAGEVFIPVLSGTLTTIAPFFPLLFWPGIIGEFMMYLPITLIITLFASLFVAFVINPVFAVSFMKKNDDHNASPPIKSLVKPLAIMAGLTTVGYLSGSVAFGNLMIVVIVFYLLNAYVFNKMIAYFQDVMLPAFMNKYRGLLRYVISGSRPYVFFTGTIVMLFVIIFGYVASNPKVEFFPSGDPNFIYVYNQMPIGTDAKVTDSVTRIIEQRVYSVIGNNNPVVKSVISNVGVGAGDPQNPDRTVTPHKSKVTIAFVEFGDRKGVSTSQYINQLRDKMVGIPGAEITVDKEKGGPPTGKPVNIEIVGEDFAELKRIEKLVRQAIVKAGIKGIEELKSDLNLNKPEIQIDIDKEKAAREGISPAQIALEIRTALYGKEVSRFRDSKEDYPIMVRVEESQRAKIEDLMNMQISYLDFASGRFRQIPIASVAKIRYGTSYSSINRKNQERINTLGSNVEEGYNATEINSQVKEAVRNINLPSGYNIRLTGEQEDQAETANFLSGAFLGAVGLILMILVAQFNSVSKPLIILSTIVLSLIGVLLGFMLFNMTFSVLMTGVGIIALAGIVVKNGILVIEFTDELRSRGVPFREAIVEAGATRLTPVLLTASAAILGLIPLGIGMNINFGSLLTHLDPEFYIGGETSVFWGPLAWAIIFGLTFCTFLTLVVVPAQYFIAEKIKAKVFNRDIENEHLYKTPASDLS